MLIEKIYLQMRQIHEGGVIVLNEKIKILTIKILIKLRLKLVLIMLLEYALIVAKKNKIVCEALLFLYLIGGLELSEAKNFSKVSNLLFSMDSNSIYKWRLDAINACFLTADISGLEKICELYELIKNRNLQNDGIKQENIIIANNIFFANPSTQTYLDTHIKSMLLGLTPKKDIILLLPENDYEKVSNKALFEYWKQYIKVISDLSEIQSYESKKRYYLSDLTWSISVNNKTKFIEQVRCVVQKKWEMKGLAPLFKINDSDYQFGVDRLLKLGIPAGAWFVSIHVREAGYKGDKKDSLDNYRNADINSYEKAIKYIIEKGGYVIRVGDPKMLPLRINDPKLIDYARSDVRSSRMDLFLFTQCKFFIGTASGPTATPLMFDIPTVGTNYAPIGHRLFSGKSLIIHKRIYDDNKGQYIRYEEMKKSGAVSMLATSLYEKNRYSLIDNTSDEIYQVTKEMFEILEGTVKYSKEDLGLRDKVDKLYLEQSGYGDIGKIGIDFLRKSHNLGLL